MNASRFFSLCFFALLVVGSVPLHAQRERLSPEDLEIVEKRWPQAKRTYTTLRYIVLKEGDRKGGTPEAGMMVKTLYKGMLLNDTVFDSLLDPKNPLTTRVGRGNLIPGWDEALQKMHRGEKWLLIVPSELGYGAKGKPPTIPRNATLVFEVELLDFSAD
jgi:FKBP-type peptidyl-prolyl cis-trans isomerase